MTRITFDVEWRAETTDHWRLSSGGFPEEQQARDRITKQIEVYGPKMAELYRVVKVTTHEEREASMMHMLTEHLEIEIYRSGLLGWCPEDIPSATDDEIIRIFERMRTEEGYGLNVRLVRVITFKVRGVVES